MWLLLLTDIHDLICVFIVIRFIVKFLSQAVAQAEAQPKPSCGFDVQWEYILCRKGWLFSPHDIGTVFVRYDWFTG